MFTGYQVSSSHTTVQTTEEVTESLAQEEDSGDCISSHNSSSYALFPDPSVVTPTVHFAAIHPNLLVPLASCPPHPLFTIEQLGVDRRLLVNRKRQLKMYRVWMQGKFKKLVGVAY
ncbi:hypothetical protein JVT61DRAFT_370 [Boletus reticuloceps]|uniref:Uncharacterized protein n=1 Tax=Boletus reticuloceps TaxID=495285 RepID=A0A8I2Z117_9AGAM|nr:hypothetical protein JVT61DRAFT_370 [Boletus reticuloceps]